MQGNIDFTGSLSGAISGGGSGGSDVTITPTLQSGTKIADYTIDETSGSLYAPTPEGLTAELPLIISNNTISIDLSGYVTNSDLNDYQEKLTAGSYINIDSNNEISCTPPITNVWYTPEAGVQQDVLIGKFTVNEVTQNVYAPSGGSSWNYSTSEVDTGQKWIDGSVIYNLVVEFQTPISLQVSWNKIIDFVNTNYLVIDNGVAINTNDTLTRSLDVDCDPNDGIYVMPLRGTAMPNVNLIILKYIKLS